MKASNSASATAAAKMAFSTNAAGPSLQSSSKAKTIAHSRIAIRAILREPLVGVRESHVQARRILETKSASIRLRGESSDLVGAREILRSGGEENVSGEPHGAPHEQRKAHACTAGRTPLDTGTGEGAARAGGAESQGPFAWQIENRSAVESQNSRGLIPIPVLTVLELQPSQEFGITIGQAAVEVKERFTLRDHGIVVGDRATRGNRREGGRVKGETSREFVSKNSTSLIETRAKIRAPEGRPPGNEARPLALVGNGVIEQIVFRASTKFVLGLAAQGDQPRARFCAGGVEAEGLLKFRARFDALSRCAQDTGICGVHVGAIRVNLHGDFNGAQCFFDFSYAQAGCCQARPVVGVTSVDGQYFAVVVVGFAETSSPSQDTRAPGLQVQIPRRMRDLGVDN